MSRIHGGFGGALFVNAFSGGGADVSLREKGGRFGGGHVKASEAMAVMGREGINNNTSTLFQTSNRNDIWI